MKREQRLTFISTALRWLVDFLGKTDITEMQVNFIVGTLTDQLPNDFPYLRKEEFRLAVKRGAAGNYGDVYTVSAASVYNFIRGFQGERKRAFTNTSDPAVKNGFVTMQERMFFIIQGLEKRKSPVLEKMLNGEAFKL